jgi:hypothetical protein
MPPLDRPSLGVTFRVPRVVGGAAIAVVVLAFTSAYTGLAGLAVRNVSAAQPGDGAAAPIYGVKIPAGYRDWAFISVARVGAPVNDMRVKLGNAAAMRAYRDGTRPFPDGTIIARLAYSQATSEAGNQVVAAAARARGLGDDAVQKLLSESFVAGPPTNVQFMIKDSKKYAATGGWGFAQFTDGKPDGEALHKTCFGCHAPAKDHDFVFTGYSR